jgi:hypothetical protein
LILSNIRALPLLQLTGGSDRRRRERGETKTPYFYGGGQSSIGMGRSHAARQLLELSGMPR